MLQITDLAGKVLLSKNVVAMNGLINVNTSHIANGTYFVRLMLNDEILTAKVVVEK